MDVIVVIVLFCLSGAAFLYLVGLFLVFCIGRLALRDIPYQLKITKNATYIKKPSGTLVKIADYRYTTQDIIALARKSKYVGKEYRAEQAGIVRESIQLAAKDHKNETKQTAS